MINSRWKQIELTCDKLRKGITGEVLKFEEGEREFVEHRHLVWSQGVRCDWIYGMAVPFRALYVRTRILKIILSLLGSQWSFLSTGVMWSNFHV